MVAPKDQRKAAAWERLSRRQKVLTKLERQWEELEQRLAELESRLPASLPPDASPSDSTMAATERRAHPRKPR